MVVSPTMLMPQQAEPPSPLPSQKKKSLHLPLFETMTELHDFTVLHMPHFTLHSVLYID